MSLPDRPMKKCAIAIDDWKLPIFERILEEHGFAFKREKLTIGVIVLGVTTDDPEKLQKVIALAQAECALQSLSGNVTTVYRKKS